MIVLAKFEIPGDDGERTEIGLARGTISGGEDIPDERYWVYQSDGDELIRYGYDEPKGWPYLKANLSLLVYRAIAAVFTDPEVMKGEYDA